MHSQKQDQEDYFWSKHDKNASPGKGVRGRPVQHEEVAAQAPPQAPESVPSAGVTEESGLNLAALEAEYFKLEGEIKTMQRDVENDFSLTKAKIMEKKKTINKLTSRRNQLHNEISALKQ